MFFLLLKFAYMKLILFKFEDKSIKKSNQCKNDYFKIFHTVYCNLINYFNHNPLQKMLLPIS